VTFRRPVLQQDICFLGAAQIGKNGDVNVSRMSKDRLTGPGGFIDITQSTRRIGFVMAFTAKGLEVDIPGDGKLGIKQEGRVKKFVSSVFEKTFSGDEAVRRGQEVTYITERAVFRRTAFHSKIELMEIAPGIDLQKDILDQMEFIPAISSKLAEMDPRIFKEGKMNVATEFFGSLDRRFRYQDEENIMYLDLFGITLNTEGDIQWFFQVVNDMLKAKVTEKGKVALVVNYNGFDVRNGLEDMFRAGTDDVVVKWCKSVKRYSGAAFRRSRLGEQLGLTAWDAEKLYDLFDFNGDGEMSVTELRSGMENLFQSKLSPTQLSYFVNTPEQTIIGRQSFERGLAELARLDESTFGRFGKFTLEEDEIASEAIF
jgi:propionate CoA-transferase